MSALGILSLACAFALPSTQSTAVEANEEMLPSLIQSGLTFVEFYAPWCTHCQQLAPELDKAADRLQGAATIAKIDATQNEALARGHGVEGFPTLLIFHQGKTFPYKGGRTSADIVSFIKKLLAPSFTTLKTKKEVDNFQKGRNVKLLLYAHGEDTPAKQTFVAYANANREAFVYAIVSDTTLFENREKDFIEMHKPFDNKKSTLEEVTEESFKEWLRMEGFRLFDEIGPTNYDSYIKRGLPMAWLFVDSLQKESKEAKEVARRLAPEFKGKLSFVFLDGTKFPGLAEQFGVYDKKYPVFIVTDQKQDTFRLSSDEVISVERARAFSNDFLGGTLTKTLRSQPRPVNDLDGNLTIVVGQSFADLVENAKTDVLISFTAPWCKHCKEMRPAYIEVADDYKDDADVRIAVFDVSKNDIIAPKFPIDGLPAVYFQAKGQEPVAYEGERSKEDFIAFVEKHKSGAKPAEGA